MPAPPINNISAEYASLLSSNASLVMMPTDWIPSEPLPSVPRPNQSELEKAQQMLDAMVPRWASGNQAIKMSPATLNMDQPIR